MKSRCAPSTLPLTNNCFVIRNFSVSILTLIAEKGFWPNKIGLDCEYLENVLKNITMIQNILSIFEFQMLQHLACFIKENLFELLHCIISLIGGVAIKFNYYFNNLKIISNLVFVHFYKHSQTAPMSSEYIMHAY